MRKRLFIFPFFVALLLSTSAYARELRLADNWTRLLFNDTTACCYANLEANNTQSNISATIKLWNDNRLIATWEESAKGFIFFHEDASVEKGKTYKLIVNYTIDGEPREALSVSGTC